jgi:hypothetical protein
MLSLPRRRDGPPRPRVGFWFGALLLFVPIFAPLLFFKPYSWFARIGWCGWLGFVVFVKLSGLSEPVIDLSQLSRQVRVQEQQGGEPDRSARGTFVQPDSAAPAPPPLDTYLRELGGGVLGRRIAEFHVSGSGADQAIAIRFLETDWYVGTEARIAEESIGAALSLFYGRDFQRVTLDFVHNARPVRVSLSKADFRRFFGMSDAQIEAVLADPKRQERSVFRAENMSPDLRQGFFNTFAKYP